MTDKILLDKYGTTTRLTLSIVFACAIMTFLFSLLCYFYLDIKGIVFDILLGYSLVITLLGLSFYRHQKLELTYNLMSSFTFIVAYIVSLHTGGINSMFATFLVLLIFFGYLSNRFYGLFWLVMVSVAMISMFAVDNYSDYKFPNEITKQNQGEFSFFILMFFIALFGGVFGFLINKNNKHIRKAKREISIINEEKSVMLREIHHRVKNNLQVVNSLLRLQSRSVNDNQVKLMFTMAQSRIVAMARLHEKIYKTENLKSINIKEHINELVKDLIKGYNADKNISTLLEIESVEISIDALLPLSLIVNELISNSLKHAFNKVDKGIIEINLNSLCQNEYELIIGDNGKGMSKRQHKAFTKGIGARLVKSFVRQLEGEIEPLDTFVGTYYKIKFKDRFLLNKKAV